MEPFSYPKNPQYILDEAFRTNGEHLDTFIHGIQKMEPPVYSSIPGTAAQFSPPLSFVQPRPGADTFDAGLVRLDGKGLFRAQVRIQRKEIVVEKPSTPPSFAGEILPNNSFNMLTMKFARFHNALLTRCDKINKARLIACSLVLPSPLDLAHPELDHVRRYDHSTDTDDETESVLSAAQGARARDIPENNTPTQTFSTVTPAELSTKSQSKARRNSVKRNITRQRNLSLAPLKRTSDAALSPKKRARREELGAKIYDVVETFFVKETVEEASKRHEQIRHPAANLLSCLDTGASFQAVMEAAGELREALAVDREEHSDAEESKLTATESADDSSAWPGTSTLR